jgi:hypothetical protein
MNIYFDDYRKAMDFAFTITKIDNGLIMFHGYYYTEIGQCPCLIIEDENLNIVNRLFYDTYLYEIQPIQARG